MTKRDKNDSKWTRREFVQGSLAGASLAWATWWRCCGVAKNRAFQPFGSCGAC